MLPVHIYLEGRAFLAELLSMDHRGRRFDIFVLDGSPRSAQVYEGGKRAAMYDFNLSRAHPMFHDLAFLIEQAKAEIRRRVDRERGLA